MAKKQQEVKETKGVMGPDGVALETMEPAFEFSKAVQVWQGPPKTGKTSTAAALRRVALKHGIEEVNPFFMLFEPGSDGVEVQCTSEKCDCGKNKSCPHCNGKGMRRKILQTLKDIDTWFEWAAKSPFNPIVIDTCDAMFQAVSDGVCARMEIRAPHMADHGVAWVDIYDEMREKFGILTGAGKGLILIMHVYMQEKRVKGGSMSTATFNVGGKTKPFIEGMADQILHFDLEPGTDGEDKRVIISQPRAGIQAGDRWGLFPEELDRGKTPEEGAKAVLGCFYEL
jgi:hypothetical protein